MKRSNRMFYSRFTIYDFLFQIRYLAHGRNHLVYIGNSQIFQVLCIRHRYIGTRDPLNGRVEIVEGTLSNLLADFTAHAAKWMRLLGNHHAIGLSDRRNNRINIQGANGSQIDNFARDPLILIRLLRLSERPIAWWLPRS